MIEGLQIAAVGVTVVFAFLTALVLAIQLLGWLLRTYGHLLPPERNGEQSRPSGGDAPRIAAVVAAIEAHRRTSRRAG